MTISFHTQYVGKTFNWDGAMDGCLIVIRKMGDKG